MNGRQAALAGSGQRGGSSGNAAGPSRDRKEQALPDASEEDLAVVRNLCQIVVRQFYSDQHAIVIDVLSRHIVMPSDILAGSLGVPTKDLAQITHSLMRDRLIGRETRSELREASAAPSGFQRMVQRSYFFLDRKLFLDVTKWRMMKMRAQIDSVLRNELDNKGYMCPRCGKSYSTLDVAALLDPVTMMTFLCDVPGCGSELVDNEDAADVQRSKDRLRRFNEQCGPILDRLRRIDAVTLPAFDFGTEFARSGNSDAWKLRALQRINPSATMNDIQEARGGAQRAASIEIDMGTDDPEVEAARRKQREREAEQQRQENALPSWWQTTQDPNAPKLSVSGSQTSREAGAEDEKALGKEASAVKDDYYARYASMAQEDVAGEDEDEMGGMEFVEVDGDGGTSGTATATPSAPPTNAHTPQTSLSSTLKRPREDEEADDERKRAHNTLGVHGAKQKDAADDADNNDDDDEGLEFEEVA